MKESESNLDFIMIPGDLVAHDVCLDPKDPSVGNYQLLKQTLSTVAQTFAKYFPNTILIPTLGNNDPKYHYEGLNLQDKAEFYGFYFDTWFSQQPRNK